MLGALATEQMDEQIERGRLAHVVPALRERHVLELVRTGGLMVELLAERLGGDPSDFEIRVASAALPCPTSAVLPYPTSAATTSAIEGATASGW